MNTLSQTLPKPSFLTKKLNQWFPYTECWGYRARRLNDRWLFGKVERPDRIIFPRFLTLWAWDDDFAWGIYRDYEHDEFNRLIIAAVFHGDSPSEEEIERLSSHLKQMRQSNPFESRGEAERAEMLACVDSRSDYQEDEFPIKY
jgi:hypothetical protein